MAVKRELIEDSFYRPGGYVRVKAEVSYELVSAEAIYSDAPEKTHRYRVLVEGKSIGEVWQVIHTPYNRRGGYGYAPRTAWHWSAPAPAGRVFGARSTVTEPSRRAAAIRLLVADVER